MPGQERSTHSRTLLLAICYAGFVSLGLPDTLIGVAWPSVRETFHVRQSDVSWIFVGSGASYFLSSSSAGRLLKSLSVGLLLAASSALVAAAAFDFALAPAWVLFAAGSLLHGLGSGAIDAGLNHYVATHFSARHMNWLHACYSLGAMFGPIIMTAAITRAHSWRTGYAIVATTLLVLAALFFVTQRRWSDAPKSNDPANPVLAEASPTTAEVLRHGMVWLHIALFFVYTGIEVSVGQWSFTILTESRGISTTSAGAWVTGYWASILAGRIGFGFVVDRIGIDRLIRLSTIAALLGAVLFAWNPFLYASPVSLALSGLGLSVIFPCLMTRTPQRLGEKLSAHAIGFQVGAAMLGAAALPSLNGVIAQHAGLPWVALTIACAAGALVLLHEITLNMGTPEKI